MKVIFLEIAAMGCQLYEPRFPLDKNRIPPIFIDQKCVRNLKEIIDKTGADIVITSRRYRSYEDYLLMWECRKLPGFVTDVTPIVMGNIGDGIDVWLNECNVECQYVIISVLNEICFNQHQLPRLLVASIDGMDEEIAQKAIAILNHNDYPAT